MSATKIGLLEELQARGIAKQFTDPELGKILEARPLSVYAGFDPTADSLHIGSLIPLLTLRRFQIRGHKPIALAGGATGFIGDPSGKSQERSLQDTDQIQSNLAGIKNDIGRILDLNQTKLVNNYDWFQKIGYIEFLRDVGKHFTINHMMTKDSVRTRLEDREHGISYTEFSYMLLQAYDFYHLYKHHQCHMQIGGSEQWGNITAGCELIRRINAQEGLEKADVYGLTFNLVMKSDGTKFGKTEQGSVWLNPKKTSPYQFFQYFMQVSDADAITYLNYFTFLSLDQIAHIKTEFSKDPGGRLAQKTLAREITTIVHGKDETDRSEKASQALFGSEIKSLDERTLLDVLAEAPSTKKSKSTLGNADQTLIDLLVDSTLCASKGAAKKDIQAGGVYVNNERVQDLNFTPKSQDLLCGKYLLLRKGKKNYHLIRFE